MDSRTLRANERIALTLSSTFIGFLAVELGLLAQLRKSDLSGHVERISTAIFAVSILALSICFFLIALWSKSFPILKLIDFQDALTLKPRHQENEPFRMMLSSNERDSNILKSLEAENAHLNKFYKPRLVLAGVGQLFVVVLLIIVWG
jgi:hypothetical protein